MNRKLLSLLVGMAAIAIVGAPKIAMAESPVIVAQQSNPDTTNSLAALLNLSDEQKARLQSIQQETAKKLGSVVTPAQQQRYLTARKNGKSRQEAVAAMQLSADQQSQIGRILQSAQQQSFSVFTPEQIEKLKTLRSQQGGQ